MQGVPCDNIAPLREAEPSLQERVGQLLPDVIERQALLLEEVGMAGYSPERHLQLLRIIRVEGVLDEAYEVVVVARFVHSSSLKLHLACQVD